MASWIINDKNRIIFLFKSFTRSHSSVRWYSWYGLILRTSAWYSNQRRMIDRAEAEYLLKTPSSPPPQEWIFRARLTGRGDLRNEAHTLKLDYILITSVANLEIEKRKKKKQITPRLNKPGLRSRFSAPAPRFDPLDKGDEVEQHRSRALLRWIRFQ